MNKRVTHVIAILALWLLPEARSEDRSLIILRGVGGEERFDEHFGNLAQQWEAAAAASGLSAVRIDRSGDGLSGRERFLESVQEAPAGPLWVVFIGHGAFDGREAKLQIEGPDLSEQDLVDAFSEREGELIFFHLGSASGGLVSKLSGEGRVIITATQSYQQRSFAYFGEFFTGYFVGDSKADADLDGNDQVSLLEAFLAASRATAGHYKDLDRIATEHALIDDNGDGLGARAEWFEGTTLKNAPPAFLSNPDGDRAGIIDWPGNEAETSMSREEQNLILRIKRLHRKKDELQSDDYYTQLETLARQLAEKRLGKENALKKAD